MAQNGRNILSEAVIYGKIQLVARLVHLRNIENNLFNINNTSTGQRLFALFSVTIALNRLSAVIRVQLNYTDSFFDLLHGAMINRESIPIMEMQTFPHSVEDLALMREGYERIRHDILLWLDMMESKHDQYIRKQESMSK
ncbi:hypothetical protein NPIL_586861 [Nephila pilipes]|uniref:Uncharacterized protein n=1 Tax=Nephila pilipes TaxID=299642 RepID=A0A8X6UE04_NEPPI|nr:hypothetical protein NPIL_586861 [Nephila pilipes]